MLLIDESSRWQLSRRRLQSSALSSYSPSVCTLLLTLSAVPSFLPSLRQLLPRDVSLLFSAQNTTSPRRRFNARSKLRGLGSIVDGDALAHPLSSTSSPTDRKAPAFAFSPTNSTGRSDLRVSICLDPRERAPVVDVNVEHGLSIHFPWPATRSNSAGSCEDRDVPLVSISKPMPLVPRARPRRVPSPLDSASSATATVTTVADSYTQFGRARVPKRSAYDVFTPKRPDSSLLGNMVRPPPHIPTVFCICVPCSCLTARTRSGIPLRLCTRRAHRRRAHSLAWRSRKMCELPVYGGHLLLVYMVYCHTRLRFESFVKPSRLSRSQVRMSLPPLRCIFLRVVLPSISPCNACVSAMPM